MQTNQGRQDAKLQATQSIPANFMPLLENLRPSEKFKEIKIRIKADKVIIIWFKGKKVVNTAAATLDEALKKLLFKTSAA